MTVPAAALQAERIAILYRRIVLLVGGQLAANFLGQALAISAQPANAPVLAYLGLAALVGSLVAHVMCAIASYQLMRELGSPVPWLWAIAILVPCVSILLLLVVSLRTQAWCRERGIRVGLVGPTRESIERLKRESSVDRIFE
jgi:hypothetical protein